jgi:autotransporter passenger strand-loop-strand repeat protein
VTTYIVSNGQTSSGVTLNSGDTETVLSGGAATFTTINSGGLLTVSSGGFASSSTINAGGSGIVSAGGVAGIKVKVVDSLAVGLPCVCTPAAAEGLDLPAALQGCLAAEAEEIAAAICHLHTDETANETCSAAGLQYIAAEFSEQQLDTQMRRVVGERG